MFRYILMYVILSLGAEVVFAQPAVVINEIMYDDTSFAEIEWIEIHNTTASPVTIGNWVVLDANAYPPASEGAFRIPAGTTIAANGYLVLSWSAISEFDGEVVCTIYFGSMVLGNSGDNVALYNAETGGTLVDGSLGSSFPDLATSEAGYSIEKCNENTGWTAISSNWHASTTVFSATGRYRRCTPGAANSVCPDVVAPDIDSIVVISATQLNLYFNESVEQITSETEAFYVATPTIGSPTSALRDVVLNRLVHLTYPPIPNNTYTMTVTGVQDLSGNVANGRTELFTVNISAGVSPIVISELMYDDTGNVDLEWVELYNRTAGSADISGWVLIDAGNYPPGASEGGWLVPASTTIPAGAYRVLSNQNLADITGEIVCTYYDSTFDLNNAGDNCALYNMQTGGEIRDGSLTLLFPDLVFANSGYSVEKCHADSGWSSDASAWHISTNSLGLGRYRRGTPGLVNTVCTGDVTLPVLDSVRVITNQILDIYFSEVVELYTSQTVLNYSVASVGNPTTATRQVDQRVVRLNYPIALPTGNHTIVVNNVEDISANRIANGSTLFFAIASVPLVKFTEVMPDANFVGAADSSGEWFEIYNASGTAASMTGWIISDGQGSDTIEGSVTLTVGQHFVFAARGDSLGNGGIPEHYDYKWGSSGWGLSLDNVGETITIRNHQNTQVAQLTYTGFPFAVGRSAQLRDVSLNPALDTNWCQAIGPWSGGWNNDWGTPRAGAICPDETPPVIDTIIVLSNTAVDVYFDEAVTQVSAGVEANYVVSLGVGTPLTANRDGANLSLVHLSFLPLTPNSYNLTIDNVSDLIGNVCVNERGNFVVTGVAQGILGMVRSSDINTSITDWNFGASECPDTASQYFLFRNFGTATLTVTPPMTVGTSQFMSTNNCVIQFSLTPNQLSTCSLRVRFAGTSRGTYLDTLRIQTNAANAVGGLVRVPLAGTWNLSPDEPLVVIRRAGVDAQLIWPRVRQTTGGCAMTSENYMIYRASDFTANYDFIGQTTDSTFTHTGAFSSGGRNFYRVTAVDN